MYRLVRSIDFGQLIAIAVVVACVMGLASAAVAVDIYTQSFEGSWPGWTQQKDSHNLAWMKSTQDQSGGLTHGGSYFAMLYGTVKGSTTSLVTPSLNLTAYPIATLEFWHRQKAWGSDQDTLSVYYKTTSGGEWNLLAVYSDEAATWTKRTIALPNHSATYYIGFQGTANYGYGVCIDDVRVSDETPVRDPVAVRISDLSHTPLPPNPIRVWGAVSGVSPVKISDGNTEITLSGVTAFVGDFVVVTGNWSDGVLTATETATVYSR